MNKISTLVYSAIICALLSSCATVMRDETQDIPIHSNVKEVNIRVLNRHGIAVYEGQAPTVVPLKTSRNGYFSPAKYTIEASKEGYVPIRQPLGRAVSLWNYLGNIVIGGIIGYLIVDPLTGRMYSLDEEVNLYMTPLPK